ncbi:unnamed protein product [Rhizophagus irregularis]|nr:unnamed protein product [Rhizophagus irregularis]
MFIKQYIKLNGSRVIVIFSVYFQYIFMSTEHLWILKENSEIYSGLTSNILNPKDKQADERFFSSSVLKGFTDYSVKNNDDEMYGDACYHFFCGILFESWKSHSMAHIDRVGFAWGACIFFAGVQHFLKANQATCNGNKFGISWQSCDDFIYLGLTLILLIQQWPNFYSNYPLCDLIRPDNNDGYNIKLSTVKEKLPKNLTDFPSIFDIDNMIEKVYIILLSYIYPSFIIINLNKEIFSELIQRSLHSLKKINNHNIPMENTSETDELEGESEDELDNEYEMDNENTQSTLELDFEDNFFEKINKAFGKTHELSPLAIMQAMSYYRVVTELGTMDIMAAIRQDRLIFEKRESSYVRVNLLSGLNEGKIHARLYDLKLDSACEFIPIISKDRTQFTCESNPFRFIAHLGSVLEEYHGTSHWLGKTLKLGDLQYATYFHFVGKSCELEQSIKEAEKIMRMRKNNANSNDE